MSLHFRKVFLSAERYESAGVFDVNSDGVPDVVSGAFWYEGPDFKKRHKIGGVKAYDDYYDDFSTIPLDINGDGRVDFITGGWWGETLRWRENTGEAGRDWPEHIIAQSGNIETTRAWDIDGDGEQDIVALMSGDVVRRADVAGEGDGFRGTREERAALDVAGDDLVEALAVDVLHHQEEVRPVHGDGA